MVGRPLRWFSNLGMAALAGAGKRPGEMASGTRFAEDWPCDAACS
jgi:hypothetical protein